MNNSLVISIIIPVYNTEKYLQRCLDSIINQEIENIEIIVINDCSPGNCKSIIEEYKTKYNSIKYIELKKNSGTLVARDVAIRSASSKYIMCVDPDDYLENNAFQELSKELEYDYDIIAFNHICENENGDRYLAPPQNTITRDIVIESNMENIRELFSGELSESMIKIIKKSLYEIFTLEKYNVIFQEDYLVMARLIYYCKSIKYIPKSYYVYFQRNDSSTQFKNMSYEKKKKTLEDLIYVNTEVYKFFKEKNIYKKFEKYLINREHTYKEWMYEEIMLNSKGTRKSELERLFSKAFTNIKKSSKLFSVIKTNKYLTIYLFGIKLSIKNNYKDYYKNE